MKTYATHLPVLDARHYLYLSSAFMVAVAVYGLFDRGGVQTTHYAALFWWFQNALCVAQLMVGAVIFLVAVCFPRFIHRPIIIFMGIVSIVFGVASTFHGSLIGSFHDKIAVTLFYAIGSLACFAVIPAREKPHLRAAREAARQ